MNINISHKDFIKNRKDSLVEFVRENRLTIEDCIEGNKCERGNKCLDFPMLIMNAREKLGYSQTTTSFDIFRTLVGNYERLYESTNNEEAIEMKQGTGGEEIAYLAGIEEGIRRASEPLYKPVNYADWLEL